MTLDADGLVSEVRCLHLAAHVDDRPPRVRANGARQADPKLRRSFLSPEYSEPWRRTPAGGRTSQGGPARTRVHRLRPATTRCDPNSRLCEGVAAESIRSCRLAITSEGRHACLKPVQLRCGSRAVRPSSPPRTRASGARTPRPSPLTRGDAAGAHHQPRPDQLEAIVECIVQVFGTEVSRRRTRRPWCPWSPTPSAHGSTGASGPRPPT